MADPTFINLDFEDAGADAGTADGWTQTVSCTGEAIAAYGPDPIKPWEDYEAGWPSVDAFVFVPSDLDVARYVVNHVGPTPVYAFAEGFEGMWSIDAGVGNEGDAFTLDSPEEAIFTTYDWPALAPETFGVGFLGFVVLPDPWNYIGRAWSLLLWKQGFWPTDLAAAQYGTGLLTYEDFEAEWRSNEDDQDAFAPIDLGPALYGDTEYGGYNAETFETLYEEITFVPKIGPPDTVVLASAHGLLVGNLVRFRTVNGLLPHPLNAAVRYRISVDTGANEVEVVVDATSAAVNWNAAQLGFGSNVFFRDPQWYWHTELVL